MTRDFSARAIAPEVLERVLDAARRVPSAGNAQGFDLVLLVGEHETAQYWDVTLPAARRAGFRWPGLLRCPVLVLVWADPAAYVSRYSEPEKHASGLGDSVDAWQTPYWTVDASFAAMAIQYAAVAEGLGVLFFGMFRHAAVLGSAFGVPTRCEPIGTLALGWPGPDAGAARRRGLSEDRPRRPLFADHPADASPSDERLAPIVHRSRW